VARNPRIPNPDAVSPEALEKLKKGIPLKCVTRRHMQPKDFVTYDAMWNWASAYRTNQKDGTGPLVYKGGIYWLANANNRTKNPEIEALKSLERQGWIVKVHEASRGRGGRFDSNHFRLVEHDEYEKTYPERCPPNQYVNSIMAEVLGLVERAPMGRDSKEVPSKFIDAALRKFAANDPMTQTIIGWAKGLSESEREKIREHLKRKSSRPALV
jgi:hypothetical protein